MPIGRRGLCGKQIDRRAAITAPYLSPQRALALRFAGCYLQERQSDRAGATGSGPFNPAFPQEVILMHLLVKVVSFFGTIVLKLRWKRR